MSNAFLVCAALCLTSLPGAAMAASMPGFQDLESSYAQDTSLTGARQSVTAAIPPGTPVAQARDALSGVGASCKPWKRQPDSERCLIHQYSLADGAADDIRWTIRLQEQQGRVIAVRLDRAVDRHGSN